MCAKHSRKGPNNPETMASTLTIRNITITPLELKHVERFDGEPVMESVGLAGNITSAFSGLFDGNSSSKNNGSSNGNGTASGVRPKSDQLTAQEATSDVLIQPFTVCTTSVRAPSAGTEVLRLTFEVPNSDGQRYALSLPGPSKRSLVMTRIDSGIETPNSAKEFTAVYLPHRGFLALFSSAHLPSWMDSLPGTLPLSSLSIPGTHNSPTHHMALPSVRCQAVAVRAQLDNGVRFLDVRVSVHSNDTDDDLALVHSAFPVSLTGTKWLHRDLLPDVYAFLDAHPSECVLLSLKREGTGKGTDQQLSRYVARRYAAGDDARRWYTAPRIPTLEEARGKVVLVRRFGIDESLKGEHGGAGWGIDGSVWPDNCEDGMCGSGMIRIQDFYEVEQSGNIDKKIDFVHKHLERAGEPSVGLVMAESVQPPPVFVNFLSASNFFNASCWPEKIAAKVNPATIEYLCTRHGEEGKGPSRLGVGDAATGVVITDWVGHQGDWDLIRCIVGWNSRLQLKQ